VEDQTISGSDQQRFVRLDDLLHLTEIDPDTLREAEFVQAQMILDTLVGQTIAKATMEETRIVVETQSGNRYFFYGFMGGGALQDDASPEPAPSRPL
jgi:hypothetical protein